MMIIPIWAGLIVALAFFLVWIALAIAFIIEKAFDR